MTDGISFIRRRAASTTTEQKVIVNHPKRSNSESTAMRVAEEEPFLIVGQEEFYEHASAITHAKFSSQGDKVASCDMDNMVKIWHCKGQPVESFKIKNSPANVLSLEWDARSDKFVGGMFWFIKQTDVLSLLALFGNRYWIDSCL